MHTQQPVTPAYLWFDCEFTSLEPDEAQLLQVALLVTGVHLERMTTPEDDVALPVALDAAAPVSEWVAQNLGELVARCRSDEGVPIAEVDSRLASLVDQVLGSPASEIGDRPVLAGNTVHADMQMVQRFLPQFAGRLHYRLLDVSALKVVWNDWRPGAAFDKEDTETIARYLPSSITMPQGAAHDAYYDIHASIAELNYYRQRLFENPS